MHSRTPLVAANWKMNPPPPGWDAPDSPFRPRKGIDVVVFPASLDIAATASASLITGAQCGRAEASGAFTGDISMSMLKNAGCTYVLCGHSERRKFHHETDDTIAQQAAAALETGLIPIVCIGETAEERKAAQQETVIHRQLSAILPLFSKLEGRSSKLILAYEPVWAISGGDPTKPAATPKDAQEMHALLRSLLPKPLRDSTRILYGGSAKPENAAALIAEPDIDGFLVGGASLDASSFGEIVDACA